MRTRLTRTSTVVAAGLLTLSLAACGSDDADTAASEATTEATTEASEAPTTEATTDAMADGPFGPACSAVPADGAGSFTGMSTAPVATAASANPVLSTLVTAVGEAGLVDTLNSASNITVFAPSNDAFAKVPADALKGLLADKAALTKVLTYHVVGETIEPDALGSGGPFTTLQGGTVEASGSGESFTVNGQSAVVCGNITTANAKVYIIDTVLMPPA